MSRLLLFHGEEESKDLGKGLVANVRGGELTIERSGQTIFSGPAECDYEVHRTKGMIEVRPLVPPRGKSTNLIGWLCGAPHMAIVTNMNAYRRKVHNYTHTYYGKVEKWENSGDGWKVYWTRKGKEHSVPFCVAFYIDKNITVDEILKMLPMMQKAGYPDWYIQKILNEKFGVTQERFNAVLKETAL